MVGVGVSAGVPSVDPTDSELVAAAGSVAAVVGIVGAVPLLESVSSASPTVSTVAGVAAEAAVLLSGPSSSNADGVFSASAECSAADLFSSTPRLGLAADVDTAASADMLTSDLSGDSDADSSFHGDVNVEGDESFLDCADTGVATASVDIIDAFVSPVPRAGGGGDGDELLADGGRQAGSTESGTRSRSGSRPRGDCSTEDGTSSTDCPPPPKLARIDAPEERSSNQQEKPRNKSRKVAQELKAPEMLRDGSS